MARLNLNLTIAASLLCLAGSYSAAALAEDTTAQQPAPAAAAEPAKPDVGYECHDEEKTGSHFSRRVCTTSEQRKKEREATADAMRRRSTGAGQLNPGGN